MSLPGDEAGWRGMMGVKKAAAYYRMSTDRQECSIPVQKDAIESYAAENDLRIVRIYEDEGRSGTSAKGRPGFLKMIEDAGNPSCEFDCVLVYDVSRFSRGDNDEAGHYRYLLRSNGLEVIYVTEDFSEDDADDIRLQVDQWSAAKQPKDTSKRTLGTLMLRARQGKSNGRKPPYGCNLQYFHRDGTESIRVRYVPVGRRKWKREIYDPEGHLILTLDGRKPLPIPDGDTSTCVIGDISHANVVRRIFRMYVDEGMGLTRIADALNRDLIAAPSGRPWLKGSVRAILENRTYRGDYDWNRTSSSRFYRLKDGKPTKRRRTEFKKRYESDPRDRYVHEGKYEAIVDPKVFDRAQRILEHRAATHRAASFRSGRARHSPYLLSGAIRCVRCKRSFQGYTQTKSKRRKDGTKVKTRYYACNGYVNGSKEICPRVLFRKEDLEQGVLGYVGKRVDALLSNGGAAAIKDILQKDLRQEETGTKGEARQARRRLAEIEADKRRLVASLTPTNKEILDGEFARLARDKEDLEIRLREIEASKREEVDIDATVDQIMAAVRRLEDLFPYGTLEEQKEFIRLWVEKIELDPDKRVGKVYMKKFPLPGNGNGNSSFEVVAGARYEPAT